MPIRKIQNGSHVAYTTFGCRFEGKIISFMKTRSKYIENGEIHKKEEYVYAIEVSKIDAADYSGRRLLITPPSVDVELQNNLN